ncbi:MULTISPECIES: arginine--tRNA ligase [Archaeoglobus]|uniref:Arginine--tRNA ligase n=1 Tax=Archaeoglobus fulgidus (strain ATCC 49558 / DSM 4304 / JCM 9628 / NBRC 100126 / VC-16) TaxID=224325 RepID=SYR_ARCFU|nr:MULTISPECIES: arginine--tRNA ligase [Archaeoglobus]O29368.1 RecName: Full=Arginine--tRNA ligase; AltName: Full=Arginyl-tRNA synthetase; Short=ArgRS [Archaeoglobus fulgidus DSM 4304]AAB90346.1 arginyl-tRNA synthetase (argS) [Archaeoglobus fulgidus DSM 4304]MDI3497940.1 arginyl-tRNA synthetase [Archaeoglobus sp.]
MFLRFIEEVIKALGEYGDKKFLRESEHADLASTIAFKLAKERKKSPKEIADEIVENLEVESEYIGSVESVNGYINFFASYEFLEDTVNVILDEDENYGHLNLKGEILIEHTSANPDGPLHIGHIRNSIIGDTIARIFAKAGFDVKTHYYVNDMGRQTAITVLGIEKFGLKDKKPDHAVAEAYIEANKLLESNPELEEQVEKLMLAYEEGDEKTVEKFRRAVETALEGIKQTLKTINVEHDEFVWESEFVRNGYVGKVLGILEERGLVKKNGAWTIELEGFDKEVVLRRENGTTLYITRDLAYHMWKNENYERFINVLGADHKLYGAQLSKILELLGLKPPEIIFFEFVSLPEGSMSTRRGKFISADELISKVRDEAWKILSERDMEEDEKRKIADAVAVGAIRFDFIKIAPEKHMTFDWSKALDFERQTASYIQYSHARACSILRKAVEDGMPELEFKGELCTAGERKLVMLLSKMPYVVKRIVSELRPNVFAEYLLSVAGTFNDFYRDHPVLKAESEVRMHRLAIVDATRVVLRNGLELLGIEPLERM